MSGEEPSVPLLFSPKAAFQGVGHLPTTGGGKGLVYSTPRRAKQVGLHRDQLSTLYVGITLLMSVVGSGMLCLPYAFKQAGLVLGEVLLLLTSVAVCYTAELLLTLHLWTGHKSYDSLAAEAFGLGVAKIIPVTNLFAIFGAAVGTVNLILGLLGHLGWVAVGDPVLVGMAIFGAVELPLLLLKNLDALKNVSMAGFASAMFLIAAVVIEGSQAADKHPGGLHMASTAVAAASEPQSIHGISECAALINFAFVLHLNVIPSYPGLRGSAKNPRTMRRVIRMVVSVCFLLYSIIGAVGYATYGDTVTHASAAECAAACSWLCSGADSTECGTADNILHNLSDDSTLTFAARTSMVFVALAAFPLLFYPLRCTAHQLMFGNDGNDGGDEPEKPRDGGGDAAWASANRTDRKDSAEPFKPRARPLSIAQRQPGAVRVAEVLVILVMVFTTAVAAPGIGVVFGLTGCTVVVGIIYVFPCALFLKLRPKYIGDGGSSVGGGGAGGDLNLTRAAAGAGAGGAGGIAVGAPSRLNRPRAVSDELATQRGLSGGEGEGDAECDGDGDRGSLLGSQRQAGDGNGGGGGGAQAQGGGDGGGEGPVMHALAYIIAVFSVIFGAWHTIVVVPQLV
jgi:amino acid permease